MRYFAELAYNGAAYHGWQRQPDQLGVQQVIEETLSLILRQPLEVTGCGRTDTGVHAGQYFLHFDFEGDFPKNFLRRLNKVLPPDIAFLRIFEVPAEAHARFDATHRSYAYYLIFQKNPFRQHTAYLYPYLHRPDIDRMQAAAALLLRYDEFYTFCRSNTDAHTMRCDLSRSEWEVIDEHQLVFHISSDRFLRGMVRLIVGMCLNVGTGKLSLDAVKKALDDQAILNKAESAPPAGLFLNKVEYEKLGI
jgi:tRNA pseudouridine38-40 synthase